MDISVYGNCLVFVLDINPGKKLKTPVVPRSESYMVMWLRNNQTTLP